MEAGWWRKIGSRLGAETCGGDAWRGRFGAADEVRRALERDLERGAAGFGARKIWSRIGGAANAQLGQEEEVARFGARSIRSQVE